MDDEEVLKKTDEWREYINKFFIKYKLEVNHIISFISSSLIEQIVRNSGFSELQMKDYIQEVLKSMIETKREFKNSCESD